MSNITQPSTLETLAQVNPLNLLRFNTVDTLTTHNIIIERIEELQTAVEVSVAAYKATENAAKPTFENPGEGQYFGDGGTSRAVELGTDVLKAGYPEKVATVTDMNDYRGDRVLASRVNVKKVYESSQTNIAPINKAA